jgi:hypothetical protein
VRCYFKKPVIFVKNKTRKDMINISDLIDKIDDMYDICNDRNIGFNETELDFKRTICDYIINNFNLK